MRLCTFLYTPLIRPIPISNNEVLFDIVLATALRIARIRSGAGVMRLVLERLRPQTLLHQ